MDVKKVLFVSAFLCLNVGCAGAQVSRDSACERGWCPAEYQGLVMGRSDVAELLRRLGAPDSVDVPEPDGPGAPLPMMGYLYRNDFGELVEVWVSRPDEIVRMVVENPHGLTRDGLTARFGSPGREQGYSFDYCLGDGESSPVYESPRGSLRIVEYRSRGIAVLVNWRGGVDFMEYLSEPYGAAESVCRGRPDPDAF